MKRRLTLLFAIGSVLILMLAINLGVASAHESGELTFGDCVSGGLIDPGNDDGIFWGPFNTHEHNAVFNPGQGNPPFDGNVGCSGFPPP